MKTANIDSIYYTPIIVNIQIFIFIFIYIIIGVLISRVIPYFQPLFVLKDTFSPLLIIYIIIFCIINLVIPRKLPENISPSELAKQEKLIVQYRYIVLIALYILGFVVYTLIIGSIVELVNNVTSVNKKIIEQFPELADKKGGDGDGDGDGGGGGDADADGDGGQP
jgi:hypothetical protein